METILGKQYETVIIGNKFGKLEVLTKSLYVPELAFYKKNSNCYFDLAGIKKIDELLKKHGNGFRVPTKKDIDYIATLRSHWVEKGEKGNVVAGRFFGITGRFWGKTATDLKKCLFLPALGLYAEDTTLYDYGSCAYYWSSTYSGTHNDFAFILYLDDYRVSSGITNNSFYACYPVRCVRDVRNLII
jgi:uncharacterized protein (TIGR02145 family)